MLTVSLGRVCAARGTLASTVKFSLTRARFLYTSTVATMAIVLAEPVSAKMDTLARLVKSLTRAKSRNTYHVEVMVIVMMGFAVALMAIPAGYVGILQTRVSIQSTSAVNMESVHMESASVKMGTLAHHARTHAQAWNVDRMVCVRWEQVVMARTSP
eukprot:SAG11_NODE_11374_length_765_cov_0.930931_1_plen_157_part_00